MARKKRLTSEIELPDLPSVPNFVWVDRDKDTPPAHALLLLEFRGNYLFGEWDDEHKLYKDSAATILEELYGPIDRYCIVLDHRNKPIDTRD